MRDNTVESIQKNLEKVIEDDAYRTQAECKSYDRIRVYWISKVKIQIEKL